MKQRGPDSPDPISPESAASDLPAAREALLARGPEELDSAALRKAWGELHESWLIAKATEIGITAGSGFSIKRLSMSSIWPSRRSAIAAMARAKARSRNSSLAKAAFVLEPAKASSKGCLSHNTAFKRKAASRRACKPALSAGAAGRAGACISPKAHG